MSEQCYVPQTANGSYGYYCREFSEILKDYNSFNNSYFEKIITIKDPILLHISLRLVVNYIIGKDKAPICRGSNPSCEALNRWLDKEKYLFTFAEKYIKNKTLWDDEIEKLWKELENDEQYEKWCIRKPYIFSTEFPEEINNIISRDTEFEDTSTNCPKLECPSCSNKITCMNQNNQESSYDHSPIFHKDYYTCYFTSNKQSDLILLVLCTIAGTFGILFLLYKFTPIISWLYRRKLKTENIQSYIREENTDEILGNFTENIETFSANRRNNMLYHSMQN
ncbi:PIR Superfamily Protein [Plasmodium ovale wallikeri]|uniref:PIR Superfamily Protein n=1 Tax=Plasmodium ovale wallikeri TaxID=864142 RepID=A0A1A9AND2_PLAOA|nr:PIR Superfamily Protein [Plasmodium ovale wallikeri]SBT57734.1 PIR Superfamily Protein [Plasmodium ovale wallikeri]